jgi:hypothetical protein
MSCCTRSLASVVLWARQRHIHGVLHSGRQRHPFSNVGHLQFLRGSLLECGRASYKHAGCRLYLGSVRGTVFPTVSRRSFSEVWLQGTRPAARRPGWSFSHLPRAAVFLCLGLLHYRLPFLRGLWIVQDNRGEQIVGRRWRTLVRTRECELTAVGCGKVLVPKAVLKGLDGILIRHFLRDSVEDVGSRALQGN